MKLQFHTNLDEAKGDVAALSARCLDSAHWPIPRNGERVRLTFDGDKNYELDVVDVAYEFEWDVSIVTIELHMPSYHRAASMSIAEWSAWFKRHRYGRTA